MPYEYRRMTLEERTAIIEERRKRGYPLHAPPHPYREAGWYFITAANFEHNPNLDKPEPKRVLSQRRKDAKVFNNFFLAFLATLREFFLLNGQRFNC